MALYLGLPKESSATNSPTVSSATISGRTILNAMPRESASMNFDAQSSSFSRPWNDSRNSADIPLPTGPTTR